MPSTTSVTGAPVEVLDWQSAVEVLNQDYKRDGLDVKSLLDSDKRGGLTSVSYIHSYSRSY